MIFAVKLQLKQYLGKENLKIMLISFLVAGARSTRTQALFWQIHIENHQECCPEGNFEIFRNLPNCKMYHGAWN